MKCVLPLVLLPCAAVGQEFCASYNGLVAALEQYGEDLRLGAMTATGGIVEFYGDDDEGGWTLIVVLPEGDTACIIAVGDGFRTIAPGELM